MPLLDDHKTGYFALRIDREKPIQSRPMFKCHLRTIAGWRPLWAKLKQARETTDNAECYRLLMEIILEAVIEWVNVKDATGTAVPFNEDAIVGRLTDHEIWELATGCEHAMPLSADEQKAAGIAA